VFAQQSSNAALVRAPDGSGFSVRPSVDGRRVDAAPLIAAIGDRLGTLDPASVTLEATPIAVPPRITTETVEAVVKKANALAAAPLELTDGEETWTIDQARLRRWTRFSATDTGYEMSFNRKALAAFVRDLADDIDRDARDAVAVTDGVSVVGYLGARNGRALDADKSIASALAALEARVSSGTPESEPVELTVNVVRPRVANQPPPENAAVVQRLSSWTTYYVPSEKNFFGVNISLPTSRLNGRVVAPGEWFDFWSAVGPLTRANGYGPGGFIRNGRTDPTGAIAGGICSCSTTLFNAAARAGLELGERHNHAYYITRYPLGLDATVSGSGGGVAQNMSFRNDTGSPIVIRTHNSYGATTFEIWGVPTGRRVAFSQPTVTNRVLARDTVEYTSALAPGARKRTEFPANGMRVSVTRTVYAANGEVLHSDTFISNYVKVDGVTLIGR
jgi:vancomycin resistance protein YoaR